jgi:hypothetical protein
MPALRFILLDNGAILGTGSKNLLRKYKQTFLYGEMPAENHIERSCLSNKEVCLPRFDRNSSPRSGDLAE